MTQPDYLAEAAAAMTAAVDAQLNVLNAGPKGGDTLQWLDDAEAARNQVKKAERQYAAAFRRWQQEIAAHILHKDSGASY